MSEMKLSQGEMPPHASESEFAHLPEIFHPKTYPCLSDQARAERARLGTGFIGWLGEHTRLFRYARGRDLGRKKRSQADRNGA